MTRLRQRNGPPHQRPAANTILTARTSLNACDASKGTSPGRRCQFCTLPLGRRWTQFEVCSQHQSIVTFLDRWWSACRECAPYVQRWQWRALADRALDIRWIRDPAGARDEHLLRGELIATWIQLERQLTGVSRPGRGAAA